MVETVVLRESHCALAFPFVALECRKTVRHNHFPMTVADWSPRGTIGETE